MPSPAAEASAPARFEKRPCRRRTRIRKFQTCIREGGGSASPIREFKDKGWESLAASIAAEPEPKLTEAQRQKVKRWIIGKDPRQYGFDFGLWSRRIVQQLVEDKLGIHLGLTSVGKLLASLEITPQNPLRRAYERDPLAVEEWKRTTDPKRKRRAKRLGAKIFFLDEAGFQSDPGKYVQTEGRTTKKKALGKKLRAHFTAGPSGFRTISAGERKTRLTIPCCPGRRDRSRVQGPSLLKA